MIVIAILSLPFVFYFVQKPDYGLAFHSDDLGRIYDEPLTMVEFQRNARFASLARALGLTLVNDLMTVNVQSENDMYLEFAWNRLVLRHEAEKLGIQPNSSEVSNYVKTLPRFQGEGGVFDLTKYKEFTEETLPSFGFNETQIEEIVADQISLNKMKEMVTLGTQIPESENKENYEKAYGKLHIAVVRLSEDDFKNDVKITDDEIAKYYESHKDQLKSEEKRKVEFVSFSLGDDEKKLTGKERIDALQKVADSANEFVQALSEKDAKFDEVATRFNKTVTSTEDFPASSPPPQFSGNMMLTQSSFQLTTANPISEAIQGADGFHVLHLLGVTEAKQLDQNEAKPKIVEALTKEKVHQLMSARGAELALQIRNALKSQEPIDKAVARTKMKLSPWWPPELVAKLGLNAATEPSKINVERPKPFAFADSALLSPEDDPEPKQGTLDLPQIRNALVTLSPGESTDFTPLPEGGFIAVLEKRDPADAEGYAAAKAKYETSNLTARRRLLFVEWMRDRRKAANVTTIYGPTSTMGAAKS